jgi:hypothetical protein
MRSLPKIGLRWNVGDVSAYGFESLRLAVWGAYRCFGRAAEYAVCVNSITVAEARSRTGSLPDLVRWITASRDDIPEFLRAWFGASNAWGYGWKYAPVRVFPDRYELTFDNDCVVWGIPETVKRWLSTGNGLTVILEDVAPYYGQFHKRIPGNFNGGLRGLPPGFNLAEVLRGLLEGAEHYSCEMDEQGLIVAALTQDAHAVIQMADISICSPFPPHVSWIGQHGAHFVGLNAKAFDWSYYDRPALQVEREHWERIRPEVYRRVGIDHQRLLDHE